jgi:hypothetical protein
MKDKGFILDEIRRIASLNGGAPVGARRFETETGIAEHEWRGAHWARWGDALSEAGFAPLEWTTGSTVEEILGLLAVLVRRCGKYPTVSEILLEKRKNKAIPTPQALGRKLGPKSEAIKKLRDFCGSTGEFADVFEILSHEDADLDRNPALDEGIVGIEGSKAPGFVYLVKSGNLYKIGFSENHWRRKGELHKQTPQGIEEVHTIAAIDDAPGIERYWHERFRGKRRHGEWFELSSEDVRIFKKRKTM